jgi:hypothetical protein|tara:strand:+ start:2402 stop:2557 length:156 start_codon:yes stop_codon:yes gene_type:complete
MTLEEGFLLGFIGTTLSIVVLGLAYHYGDKEEKPKKLTSLQKSLDEINKKP